MTPEELAAIEARHFRDPAYSGDWCAVCTDGYGDADVWPCDAARLLAALREAETLTERGYWYFLMTDQGGPDGSDLDYAVRDDFLEALIAWADDEKRVALEAYREATK